jgi:hypothetical protein
VPNENQKVIGLDENYFDLDTESLSKSFSRAQLWRGGLSDRRTVPFGCAAVAKSANAF